MPGAVLTTASTLLCPHGGRVLATSTNALATAQGAALLLATDMLAVVGCPFAVGPKSQPCVTVRWLGGSTQAAVGGTPMVLQSSVGLCFSAEQAPQGAVVVVQAQATVQGR